MAAKKERTKPSFKLLRSDVLKIGAWVGANKEYIEKSTDSYETLSEACIRATGCKAASPRALKNICRDMDIRPKQAKVQSAARRAMDERYQELQRQVNELRVQLYTITEFINDDLFPFMESCQPGVTTEHATMKTQSMARVARLLADHYTE